MTTRRGKGIADDERARIVDLYTRLRLTVRVIAERTGRSETTINSVLDAAGVRRQRVADRIGSSIDGVRS